MSFPLQSAVKQMLPAKVRTGLRKCHGWWHLACHDLRVNLLGDIFPLKPTAISMMANDTCNSRCQMCLIWQRKRDHEITPEELRQVLAGIAVSFGATVTSANAPFIDDLLDYAKEHDLYGRFRVAEFIDRLYNAPQKDFIRNFDALTQYHLGLFFFRLRFDYEKDLMIQNTYASIRGTLVEGKPRTTGCPYHHTAVILTSRGELLYCSPKSPNLGSILTPGSAKRIFFSNLGQRKKIRENHCDNCIHDYHVPETFREKVAFYLKHRRIEHRYNCGDLVSRTRRIAKQRHAGIEPSKLASERVLIVGWYGTESVGGQSDLMGNRQPAPPPPASAEGDLPFEPISVHQRMDQARDGVAGVARGGNLWA